MQKQAYEQVIYIPLGQYLAPSGWRKSLSGVLDGPATPVFWNIEKRVGREGHEGNQTKRKRDGDVLLRRVLVSPQHQQWLSRTSSGPSFRKKESGGCCG